MTDVNGLEIPITGVMNLTGVPLADEKRLTRDLVRSYQTVGGYLHTVIVIFCDYHILCSIGVAGVRRLGGLTNFFINLYGYILKNI